MLPILDHPSYYIGLHIIAINAPYTQSSSANNTLQCRPDTVVGEVLPDIELFSDFEGFVNIASSFRVLEHLSISFTTITKTGDAYPYENSLVRVVVSASSIHVEHSEVQNMSR